MVKETLSPEQKRMLNTQVAALRDEIRSTGESIANCDKLIVLCPRVAIRGQWGEIAKIAIEEGWSFTFFPNGDVRFAPLVPANAPSPARGGRFAPPPQLRNFSGEPTSK